ATSEHKEGRAWDWGIPDTKADHKMAQQVVDWLVADHGEMARRFGIEYIIWNRHIWGVYRMSDGWRPYSGESAHTDHIHGSFGAGTRTALIAWQKKNDVPVTGVLDNATWHTLVPASPPPSDPPPSDPPPSDPPPGGGGTAGSGITSLDQLAHDTSVTPYLS